MKASSGGGTMTVGLWFAGRPCKGLTNLVHQCVDLGLLEHTPGDRPVVRLTEDGGHERAAEVSSRVPPFSTRRTKADTADWEGVDRSLFERPSRVAANVAASEGSRRMWSLAIALCVPLPRPNRQNLVLSLRFQVSVPPKARNTENPFSVSFLMR